jgi:hypothetical protein
MANTSLPAGASALHEENTYPVTLSDLKTFLERLVPHRTVHAVAMSPEDVFALVRAVNALCDVAFDALVRAEHAGAITSLLESSSMFPQQHPVLSELDNLTADAVQGLRALLGCTEDGA